PPLGNTPKFPKGHVTFSDTAKVHHDKYSSTLVAASSGIDLEEARQNIEKIEASIARLEQEFNDFISLQNGSQLSQNSALNVIIQDAKLQNRKEVLVLKSELDKYYQDNEKK